MNASIVGSFCASLLFLTIRFNKYIKGKRYKKYDKELVDMISNHFECSKLQTKEYLELINKEEIKEILEKYGKDKKTIKRLCK